MDKELKNKIKAETIKVNVAKAHNVLLKAKLVNAGQYVHEIRNLSYKLENLLKKKSKLQSIGTKEFKEMSRITTTLSARLYWRKERI